MDAGVLTAAAVIVATLLLTFDRFGLLNWIKPRSPADAAGEILIRDKIIERVERERDDAQAKAARLEHERSNEPVLELVAKVAGICEQTLTKLASFNGSLAHIEAGLSVVSDGLNDATEGMKALTGTIADLHDIPLIPPPPRRKTS